MIVVNFAHPLTEAQQVQIESETGQSIGRIVAISVHIDNEAALMPQIINLADQVGLTSAEWQSFPLLINPPAYAPVAVTLLAELHGRMGYFPAVMRIRPQAGSTPPQYEVAEIINLQQLREAARHRR